MTILLTATLAVTGCTAANAATDAPATPHAPLDLRGRALSLVDIDDDSFHLELNLAGLLPAGDDARDFTASIIRVDGEDRSANGRAPRYNQSVHGVDPSNLRLRGDRVTGSIEILIEPDRWVPADGKQRTIVCQIDGRIAAAPSRPALTEHSPTEMRFWTIFPESQGSFRAMAGTFTATISHPDGESEQTRGQLTGRLTPAVRPGTWNMGEPLDGGIALRFDLGTRRQNWNHARLAVMELPRPADLRAAGGLRCVVTTDQPRLDAAVTLWLRESDGSWYYVRNAVPLAASRNEAYIEWSDFAEAEWVAPTNHMDEDYVLDIWDISHAGIGVVNPLGIGEVQFTLEVLEPAGEPRVFDAPARAHVTGRTLSVNDHNVVPAGIFGGYAGHLPQEFRPGCQRDLYAGSYPRVPRQAFVLFRSSSLGDWQQALAFLRGDSPLAAHLRSLADDRTRTRLMAIDVERYLTRARNPQQAPGEMIDLLNQALRSRQLHQPDAWADVSLSAELRRRVAQEPERNDTEVMELNRRLLEAAIPQIVPVSDYGPTEAFFLDCFGERKEPAHLLLFSDWHERLTNYGRQYGLNARRAGVEVHWEFWNEPYLNWAERSRVNLQDRFFVTEGVEAGDPAVARSTGEPIPHFVWTADEQGRLRVIDETAFSYWSGRGNGWIYDQMLAAVGPAMKEANPDVRIVAGWGFRWHEDHWAAWDMLYKPTIDRNIDWIDGIHEHHYQGDTTAMNGSYEVLVAYGVTAHDKWLYAYNTETNDLIDAPARGAVSTPALARAATAYRRMSYNMRDLIYCVHQSPDKFIARTILHPNQYPQATQAVYGMLRDLRGRLVETASDDRDVWVVASVDGTDPKAMPPHDGQTLVVVAWNEHRTPRTIELTVDAPEGTVFQDGQFQQTFLQREDFSIGVHTAPVQAAGRRQMTFRLDLPERTAWQVSLPLSGEIVQADQVSRRQFFAADILQVARPDEPILTRVNVDAEALATADAAWLRIVVEEVAPQEAVATVAGQALEIPKAYTSDNGMVIFDLPLDVQALREAPSGPQVPVEFTVARPGQPGYRVNMTSIVLEHRQD